MELHCVCEAILLSLLYEFTRIAGAPIRQTQYGKVRGMYHKGHNFKAELYLGIPYAEPPVGDLRFKMPQTLKPWKGIKDAKDHPPFCIQFWYPNVGLQKRKQSEDCLYLNILIPAEDVHERKYPVLVWIHGGSYQVGGVGSFPINGLINAFVSKGVVVVMPNYRLGPLGYLSLMNKDCPGNYGLGDQLYALNWISRNIEFFNGDPQKITVAGESAGGSSISLLAISDRANGLFQRMIIRSASSMAPWALRSRNTDLNSHTLVRFVACYSDENGTKFNNERLMYCLRYNTSSDDLLRAWNFLAIDDVRCITDPTHKAMHYNHPFFAHTYFTPVVDSYMLNQSLIPNYSETGIRKKAHIPLLIGVTTAECMGYITWIIHGDMYRSIQDRMQYVVPSNLYRNHEQVKEAVFKQYFKKAMKQQRLKLHEPLVEIASDQNFMAPSMKEANLYSESGVPVYAYRFHHWNDDLKNRFLEYGIKSMSGTPHGFDMVFLFKSTAILDGSEWPVRFTQTDDVISDELSDGMVNFIKFGKPTEIGDKWPAYKSHGYVHTISANESSNNDYAERQMFWNNIIPVVDSLTLQNSYKFSTPSIECKPEEEHEECFYKSGFFIALVCAILFLLSTCALGFFHCGTKSTKARDL